MNFIPTTLNGFKNQKTTFPIILLLLIIFMSGCTGKKDDGILLRLDYKTNQEYMLTYQSNTSFSNLLSGSLRMTTYAECKLKVMQVDSAGFIDMRVDINRLRIESLLDNEWESYDSNKSESEMTSSEKEQHALYKEMLESPLKYVITDIGRINTPLRLANGKDPEGPFELGFVQLELPEEKVSLGSEWTFERYIRQGSQKFIANNTIKKMNDKAIVVRMEGELPGFGNLPEPTKLFGEYVLDRQTCNVVEGKISMTIKGGGSAEVNFTVKNIER